MPQAKECELPQPHHPDQLPSYDDPYVPERLTTRLQPLGYALRYFEEASSTMDEAPHVGRTPTIILADYQWDGRGRRGKGWQAEKGKSILMTLVEPFDPSTGDPAHFSLLMQRLFTLTTTTTLQELTGNYDIGIRGTTDLTVRGHEFKKLGGFLSEIHRSSNKEYEVAFSEGLNVYPQSFQKTDYGAVTVSDVTPHVPSREDFVVAFASAWYHVRDALRKKSEAELIAIYDPSWRSNNLLVGQMVRVSGLDKFHTNSIIGTVIPSSLKEGLMLHLPNGATEEITQYDPETRIDVITQYE